jgi:hypothetical protein
MHPHFSRERMAIARIRQPQIFFNACACGAIRF